MNDLELQEPDVGLTPHLAIGGGKAAEAIDFYKAAFGAEELMRHAADDGRLMHAHLKVNGASLMMHDHFAEHHGGADMPEPVGVMLHCRSRMPTSGGIARIGAGASVVIELADQFWGDRYGQLKDPFGHIWSIGAPSATPQE